MANITFNSSLPGIYYNGTLVNGVYYNGTLVYSMVTQEEYTITFDSMGGSDVAPMTTVNGKLSMIPTPTYSGHSFEGWYYLDDNNNEIYVLKSTVFTQDTTVFAKWTTVSYERFPSIEGGDGIWTDDEYYWGSGFNSGTRYFIIELVVWNDEGYPYQECTPGDTWNTWIGGGREVGYWTEDTSVGVYISINDNNEIVLTEGPLGEVIRSLNVSPDDEIGWNTY